jgi:uncharacterized damage-inducible protein DinB
MAEPALEELRYPIGKFDLNRAPATADERKKFIDELANLPERLRQALNGLNGKQLETPYREGGWTVRQLVHHIADSHMNAYIRFKLALTEDAPTIKPYKEAAWAELADSRLTPVDVSLALVESLHSRWVVLLRTLQPADWARTMIHPERGTMTLDLTLAMYAWHGAHHVAHITALRERNGW